jgi:hypothetical protein
LREGKRGTEETNKQTNKKKRTKKRNCAVAEKKKMIG